MKTLFGFAAISLAVFGLIAAVATAQSPKPLNKTVGKQAIDDDQLRTRAIRQKVQEGKMDGVQLVIYKVEGKDLVSVDPSRNFQNGDEIKVEFQSSFDGYVYFVNIEPSGKKAVIYPIINRKEQNNMISAGQVYMLPHSTTFQFIGEKGIEVFQVIMSRQPIPFFDDAIRNSNGELGKTASSAAAELVGLASKKSGIDIETVAKVLPEDGREATRSRAIRLAPPLDKKDKGTVIAVPDGLKDGVAVFEVRLRHM